MKNRNINFVGNLKKYLIGSGAIILIGLILMFTLGVELDINFKGGSRFTYTYEGKVDFAKVEKVANKTLNAKTVVTGSDSVTDAGSSKVIISMAGVADTKNVKDTKDTDGVQNILLKALQKKFAKNKIAFAESNVVEASIAKGFYAKSLVSVFLAGVLVIIYVGIRFRKIGGVSAAIFAWVALIHDVIIAFIACIVFRLTIDTNFIAVVLTILGYSLNDTIVIYDRVRENRKKNRAADIGETLNLSINQTLTRTIVTSITTFVAVLVVALVAEFYGLTTLRSFAIPMSIGIISGTYSSICLAGPLWVKWQQFIKNRKAKKSANYSKK